MGDVEDPEIYAAIPIHEWEQTEQGKWVMEHCSDPRFNLMADPSYMGHRVVISGELADKDATYFTLKWGK
jgi:hypothetical protein